jgi:8-oxo-dGTP pyrophosphatase MutT (NUDIX family)
MNLNRYNLGGFRPFFVANREVGWVRHRIAERLADFRSVFDVGSFGVALRPTLATPAQRTDAVAETLSVLADEGVAPPPRHERYAVTPTLSDAPLFELDRAHVPVFGVLSTGVHLNGYVPGPNELRLWVARRADDRAVAPGKLDNLVAGGRPVGLSPRETLMKECDEEAGIDPGMSARARPAGLVSYCLETDLGLKRDTLFVYDLEVPDSFAPVNRDGEIAAFMLWPMRTVLETLRDGDAFKFNVPLVILDFAVRQGILTPETEPDYASLVYGLRRPLP